MSKAAVIVLGSDLQDPASQVRVALQVVGGYPVTRINKISSLYVTASVGYDDQPDSINAVCAMETSLSAEELLTELNRIEAAFGHGCSFHNAPRTLDLDIINFDGRSNNDPHPTLSHPRAYERGFITLPLAEILPTFRLGGEDTATRLATELGGSDAYLLGEGTEQD